MDYILIESPIFIGLQKGFERFIKNTELKLIGRFKQAKARHSSGVYSPNK